MTNWPFVAAIPPLLIWIAVYAYLAKIDGRIKTLEKQLKGE